MDQQTHQKGKKNLIPDDYCQKAVYPNPEQVNFNNQGQKQKQSNQNNNRKEEQTIKENNTTYNLANEIEEQKVCFQHNNNNQSKPTLEEIEKANNSHQVKDISQIQSFSIQNCQISKQTGECSNNKLRGEQKEEQREASPIIKTVLSEEVKVVKSNDGTQEYFKFIEEKDYSVTKQQQTKQQLLKSLRMDSFLISEEQIEKLIENLKTKNCTLTKYIASGGFGIVFEGVYRNKDNKTQPAAFKVLFGVDKEDIQSFQNEIEIMRRFQFNRNIVSLIDYFEFSEDLYVLALEMCQCNLLEYLKKIQNNNAESFSQEDLQIMLFDLLDGLLLMRVFKTLHFDIKPSNILLSQDNVWLYGDFGISEIKTKNLNTYVRGCSVNAPKEQKDFEPTCSFPVDIYSLGKSFEMIIKVFATKNRTSEFVKKLSEIIEEQMTKEAPEDRNDCENVHHAFLELLKTSESKFKFFDQYLDKIKIILEQYPYDNNKDIPYYTKTKLYYSQIMLYIYKDIKQDDSGVLLSLDQVSQCYFKLNNIQEALNTQLQMMEMSEYQYQPSNIFMKDMLVLSNYYLKLGNTEIGLKVSDKIISKLDDTQIDCCKQLLADVLLLQGKCYCDISEMQKALLAVQRSYQLSIQLESQSNQESISESSQVLGEIYIKNGEFDLAHMYLQKYYQIYKKLNLKNHPRAAQAINSLAECYYHKGKYLKAHELFSKSYNMRIEVLDPNHEQVALSLLNIGKCCIKIGLPEDGLSNMIEALNIIKSKSNNLLFTVTLNNIGECYRENGEYGLAIFYLQDSLEKRRTVLGSSLEMAITLSNLGLCHKSLGNYKEALEFSFQSLEMLYKIQPLNIELQTDILNVIGSCYFQKQMYGDAQDYFEQSLSIRQQHYKEEEDELVADSLCSLGVCYLMQKSYQKAYNFVEKSLKIREVLYKDILSKEIIGSLKSKGACLQCLGRPKEALTNYLQALELAEKLYIDKNQIHISDLQIDVGDCYKSLDDSTNSLNYYQAARQSRIKAGNTKELLFKRLLFKIGQNYFTKNEWQSAKFVLLECLDVEIEPGNEGSEFTMDSINFLLGKCCQHLKDNKNAIIYLNKDLEVNKRLYSVDSQEVGVSLSQIAIFYQQINQYKESIPLYKEALLILSKFNDSSSKANIVTLTYNLGSTYLSMRDYTTALKYYYLLYSQRHKNPHYSEVLNTINLEEDIQKCLILQNDNNIFY